MRAAGPENASLSRQNATLEFGANSRITIIMEKTAERRQHPESGRPVGQDSRSANTANAIAANLTPKDFLNPERCPMCAVLLPRPDGTKPCHEPSIASTGRATDARRRSERAA